MPVYISPIKHNCSSYKVIDLTIALKCINFRLESRVEWVRAQSHTRYIAGIRLTSTPNLNSLVPHRCSFEWAICCVLGKTDIYIKMSPSKLTRRTSCTRSIGPSLAKCNLLLISSKLVGVLREVRKSCMRSN